MTTVERPRRGPRRAIAVLAATAVVVTGLGLAYGSADAGSSVTPQSGPAGRVVYGTYQGKAQKLQTMLFQVDVNGKASFMFCIDISTTIEFGVSYDEKSWSDSSVPNLANVARILSQTSATTTKDPIEIAAAQAAIWHFSDGFALDAANPKNDPAVTARYNALVSDATASPVPAEPAGTLAVVPGSATAAQGQAVFFDVTTTATAPLSIELSDAAVTAHRATGDVCDVATPISTTGPGRICLTASSPRSQVTMTLRTGAAPLSAGRVFIRPKRQKLIIGKSGQAQSAETVVASWSANGRPAVSVTCPADGVRYGAPTTFTAKGTDPDGDVLTYAWTLNGALVPGQTGPTLTINPAAGDRLSVTVADAAGQTASVEANCAGKNPPTVALVCPDPLLVGQENSFTAIGSDPDGDTLTYSWSRNGNLLSSTNGPNLRTVVNAGDDIRVSVTDTTGETSAEVAASCIPQSVNRPPTVTIVCPAGMVYGRPATFTAQGADPDGDPLTYVWRVNDQPVAGQTGPSATVTVAKGDTVSVTANDGSRDSEAATATGCSGSTPNRPPTVQLVCAPDLIWGEDATFTADASDPDGDSLTYRWTVNGKVVPGATSASVTAKLERGDVIAVTATDPDGAASAEVTGNCAGNGRPTVALDCPATVVYGEPTVFTATGTDPDGDALTFLWRVNGVADDFQTGPSASLVVRAGDRVNVSAVDPSGAASASRTVQCAGATRPAVTITCPLNLTYGEPFDFIANGVDPDGDTELTYAWYLNGAPIAGATGPKATVTVSKDDVLTVTAMNSGGVVSASASADCVGNHRPQVELACPEDLVFGRPTTFTATGTDADGDELTYTWSVDDEVVEGATGPVAELTLTKGQRVTVTATDAPGATSTTATSTCVGTSPPEVRTVCPERVVWGEPATFTATGTDDDGDTLTYRWTIDGVEVEGVSGPTLTARLEEGAVVAVTATDPTGLASATATFDCGGSRRPVLTLICPSDHVFGQPADFVATVAGADAADLAFTWALNGTVLPGRTGSKVTLAIQPTDVVAVTAITPQGLVAETVGTSCTGTKPPVPPVPSMPEVLSRAVQQAAVRSVASLASTGGEVAGMVVAALAALGLGLGFVAVGRRRSRRAR